jgi:hypothetical protein
MITTFEIDQSKIDAPEFPRNLSWWRNFVPAWPGVEVGAGPDSTIYVTVDGDRNRGAVMGQWLRNAGTAGRLADAITEIGG